MQFTKPTSPMYGNQGKEVQFKFPGHQKSQSQANIMLTNNFKINVSNLQQNNSDKKQSFLKESSQGKNIQFKTIQKHSFLQQQQLYQSSGSKNSYSQSSSPQKDVNDSPNQQNFFQQQQQCPTVQEQRFLSLSSPKQKILIQNQYQELGENTLAPENNVGQPVFIPQNNQNNQQIKIKTQCNSYRGAHQGSKYLWQPQQNSTNNIKSHRKQFSENLSSDNKSKQRLQLELYTNSINQNGGNNNPIKGDKKNIMNQTATTSNAHFSNQQNIKKQKMVSISQLGLQLSKTQQQQISGMFPSSLKESLSATSSHSKMKGNFYFPSKKNQGTIAKKKQSVPDFQFSEVQQQQQEQTQQQQQKISQHDLIKSKLDLIHNQTNGANFQKNMGNNSYDIVKAIFEGENHHNLKSQIQTKQIEKSINNSKNNKKILQKQSSHQQQRNLEEENKIMKQEIDKLKRHNSEVVTQLLMEKNEKQELIEQIQNQSQLMEQNSPVFNNQGSQNQQGYFQLSPTVALDSTSINLQNVSQQQKQGHKKALSQKHFNMTDFFSNKNININNSSANYKSKDNSTTINSHRNTFNSGSGNQVNQQTQQKIGKNNKIDSSRKQKEFLQAVSNTQSTDVLSKNKYLLIDYQKQENCTNGFQTPENNNYAKFDFNKVNKTLSQNINQNSMKSNNYQQPQQQQQLSDHKFRMKKLSTNNNNIKNQEETTQKMFEQNYNQSLGNSINSSSMNNNNNNRNNSTQYNINQSTQNNTIKSPGQETQQQPLSSYRSMSNYNIQGSNMNIKEGFDMLRQKLERVLKGYNKQLNKQQHQIQVFQQMKDLKKQYENGLEYQNQNNQYLNQ